MTTYAWVGRTRAGQVVHGERMAESSDALTALLRREQIQVTKVTEAPKKEERYRRVPDRNLAIFTRQFSVMIDSGPAARAGPRAAREGRAGQAARGRDRPHAGRRRSGQSLAEAMMKRAYAFDSLYTHMIAAGEAGGILDVILKRLSIFIEKQAKLKSQVKSAMIYPIAVLVDRGHRRPRHPVEGHSDVHGSSSRASAPSCRSRRASSSG